MDQPLMPMERRRIAMDIVRSTFRSLEDPLVSAVATWAITLAGLSDETLLKIWSDCDDEPAA